MILSTKIFLLLLTYLWGSIPFGYILTKFYTGKNILEQGSGNIGSTNVKRIAGRRISFVTQLLDMLKGLFPVALFLTTNTSSNYPIYLFTIALATIIGHDFSIFLKFKGGKGVNTTLGASVLIAPYSVIFSIAIYFIVKWRFKYVSVGSIALAITMPLVELILHGITQIFSYLALCSVLIILLHRKNIIRLVRKTELQS